MPQPALAQKKVMFKVGGSSAQQANRSKRAKGQSLMLGSTLMFFDNSASQAGQDLPGGRTIYSTVNLQYNWPDWFTGIGLIYDMDFIGEQRQTNAIGVKGELSFGGYYIEAGSGTVSEKFTNRAIATRNGTRTFYGGGIRVPFLYDSLYFDGGIRSRNTIFTKQDGETMQSPLTESVTMPFIGMGISL